MTWIDNFCCVPIRKDVVINKKVEEVKISLLIVETDGNRIVMSRTCSTKTMLVEDRTEGHSTINYLTSAIASVKGQTSGFAGNVDT